VDLILRNKKILVLINQENMGSDLILDFIVLPKTVLLILQCEVSRCHARRTSFLFPETEVILDEFFEPNETILPHNIAHSPSDLWNELFVNKSLTFEGCGQHHFVFLNFEILESLASAIPCFVYFVWGSC
jgi:hypothetical protein